MEQQNPVARHDLTFNAQLIDIHGIVISERGRRQHMRFFAHWRTRQKPKFELNWGQKELTGMKEHRCLKETPK